MATRYLQTDFWSDTKIRDNTSEDERYLMLYFMTNPHTNQTGCYEIPISTILFETGFSKTKFDTTMANLENLNLCSYDYVTQEVLINNWYKYNWTKSSKVEKCIRKEIEKLKSHKFIKYINEICIPYAYPIDTLSGKKRKEKERKENKKEINKEKILEFIEKEFGRTISGTEYELFNTWNIYDSKVIILAVKEAILNQAKSFKYIDKILFNWAKQGLKSKKDVEQYLKQRKENTDNKETDFLYQYEEF